MSTRRAFVIQFLARTPATPERFEGRVEHVGSGEATHFASPRELVDFVSRLLGGPDREARQSTGAPPLRETGVRRHRSEV
jgi:hypothetical protein